jgi:hypothetical protein
MLEGLQPSLSGFVRSPLRNQKPTFSNVTQEAELIHKSGKAPRKVPSTRVPSAGTSRSRLEVLRPYHEAARQRPVVAIEGDRETDNDYFCSIHPVDSDRITREYSPDISDVATAFDEILLDTLSHSPQQVRYCYTCWRPGHFSADFSLMENLEEGLEFKRSDENPQSGSENLVGGN